MRFHTISPLIFRKERAVSISKFSFKNTKKKSKSLYLTQRLWRPMMMRFHTTSLIFRKEMQWKVIAVLMPQNLPVRLSLSLFSPKNSRRKPSRASILHRLVGREEVQSRSNDLQETSVEFCSYMAFLTCHGVLCETAVGSFGVYRKQLHTSVVPQAIYQNVSVSRRVASVW